MESDLLLIINDIHRFIIYKKDIKQMYKNIFEIISIYYTII